MKVDIQKMLDTLMGDLEQVIYENTDIDMATKLSEELRPLLNCYTHAVVATVRKEKENG